MICGNGFNLQLVAGTPRPAKGFRVVILRAYSSHNSVSENPIPSCATRSAPTEQHAQVPSAFADAGGIQTAESQRRNCQDGKDGGVVGAGGSGSSTELARRSAGDRSQSTGWTCHRVCIAIWEPPTSSRVHNRGCGNERETCAAGEADIVLRWVAGAYLITEKNFRKIMGHENLWTLAAVLGRSKKAVTLEEKFA
jgi:hypothetical protein